MKLKYFVISFFLFSECKSQVLISEIDSCAKLIIDNYVGFRDKTNISKFQKFVTIVKKNESIKDPFYKISLLTTYFKDEHLIVQDTSSKWLDSCYLNPKSNLIIAKEKLKKGRLRDRLTGYWVSSDNKSVVAIVPDFKDREKYAGILVENKRGKLLPGSLKFRILRLNNHMFTEYVSENKTRIITPFRRIKEDVIQLGALIKLYRLKSYDSSFLMDEPIYTTQASFERLDSNINLLKVPAGSFENIVIVDSLLKVNQKAIESAKYMIVDLRNNGGGTILPLMKLMKYVNTGPVHDIASEILCSEGVIDKSKELINTSIKAGADSTQIANLRAQVDSLQAHKGAFYYIKPEISEFDSVYKLPIKVGIIINFTCRSATELMILRFLQSKKTILFGENSFGAVDYLEFLPYSTPINNYILRIARTRRSFADKKSSIDNKGIKPHVYIDLPESKWVDFVVKYLNSL